MKNLQLYGLAILAVVALAGCGNDSSITGTTGTENGAVTFEVTDPLDGSLNSTDGMTPPEPGRRLERLQEILGLTDEQVTQIAEAYQTLHDGIAALRQEVRDGTITVQEAHAAADALREAFEASLQVILTEEQWNQLQEMRQNADGNGNGRRDPQDRLIAWLTEIGASQDQIDQVLAAAQTLKDGMIALHRQLRDGTITPAEARDAAMALRDAFDAALQSILTAEQYAALQELRPDCPGPHPGQGPPPGPPPGHGRH